MPYEEPKTNWKGADQGDPEGDQPGAGDFNRIEGNIKDNHDRIDGHDSDITNINTAINNHSNTLSNLEDDINNNENEISNINNTLDNYINNILFYYKPSENILAESLSVNICYLDTGQEAVLKEFIFPAQFGKFRVSFDVWVDTNAMHHLVISIYDEKGNKLDSITENLFRPSTWITISKDPSIIIKPGYKIELALILGGLHLTNREGRIRNARIKGDAITQASIIANDA